MKVDLIHLRTVPEGAFATANENIHLDSNTDILQYSGETTVENVTDNYIFDNRAYVTILSDYEAYPFWIRMVHLSTKTKLKLLSD